MIQTDRFSPARTISLAALYISENRRTLLLRTGLVFGALICLALFNLRIITPMNGLPMITGLMT